MIHLFRKVRHKLLKDNSFRKYVIYAFGEIFLVVIGILLALQFNNNNQNKENNKKERGYLISIVEDIEYQKTILNDMKRHSLESIDIAKTIIKSYNKYRSFTKIDSLNYKLNLLIETYSFPNTNNTYSELVSSGQLNLIRNKDLSIDIINYYLYSQESFDDVNNNRDNIFYPQVYPTIKKLCQISMYEEDIGEDEEYLEEEYEDLQELINKRLDLTETKLDLLNAIKIRIQILSVHVIMIDEILEFAKELIVAIDKDLGLEENDVNHYD